jgi:hypothetical protein
MSRTPLQRQMREHDLRSAKRAEEQAQAPRMDQVAGVADESDPADRKCALGEHAPEKEFGVCSGLLRSNR